MPLGPTKKPNRVSTPEDKKDEAYHIQFGKYCTGALAHPSQRVYQTKTLVNWNFYQNNQWIFEEDLESFLQDESGDVRNRIRWTRNIIQPMVQEFIGNTIRTDFTAKAVSISDFVINRREQELARLKLFTRIANQGSPELKETIQKSMPIGKDEEETEEIFENLWTDHHVQALNDLLKYVDANNNFDQAKVELTVHLAMGGLGVMKGYEFNGEHIWDVKDPLFFFFDYGARKKDLRDAEYMGECHYMTSATINEKWQNLDLATRTRIEEFSSENDSASRNIFHYVYGDVSNRIPVYETYWKDIERQEYGYVTDEAGYEYFTRINYEGGKYTDKDLITPKDETNQKYLGKGKKKRIIYKDVIRFCQFISAEFIGGSNDVVLEYGIMPYQETNSLNPSRTEFPYKCMTWEYHNGLIVSPLDVVIDSQRLINRVLSIAESRVNNSRGSGTVIDRSAIDSQGGEEEVQRNMNISKPLIVDSRGRGVQNVVGNYGTSLGNDTELLYNISDRLTAYSSSITGANEQMAGTKGKGRGAIDTDPMMGQLINENFYYCIAGIFEQVAQSIATQGKMIYAESQRKLSIISGDSGAGVLFITKDMANEDFRTFIRRTGSDVQEKYMANQTLTQMRMAGLIEEPEFANWYDRATMDDIGRVIRDTYKRRKMSSKVAVQQQGAANQAQAQQQQGLMQQAAAEKNRMLDIQLNEAEKNRNLKLDSIRLRAMGQLMKQREAIRLKAQAEGIRQ